MKFYYKPKETIVQNIKNKQTGAINRFVVCVFDANGEFETIEPRIIHILQTKLPGCTWDEERKVELKDVKEILSDEELKESGLKRFHEMSYKELQQAYSDITGKSAIGKKKADILKELE